MSEPIAVLIPTYNRHAIVQETVGLLRMHLVYDGRIDLYVSEDGEMGRISGATLIEGPHQGLGANLNYLLMLTSGYDLVMQMDDDHHLRKPLDLTTHAAHLRTNAQAGAVRLMGVGGHRYTASLEGDYWRLHWDGPELYVASNRPHLKHARFHAAYGGYPEGMRLGATEEAFCHQCKDAAKALGSTAPAVYVPLCQDDSAWSHVGDSWQLRGL